MKVSLRLMLSVAAYLPWPHRYGRFVAIFGLLLVLMGGCAHHEGALLNSAETGLTSNATVRQVGAEAPVDADEIEDRILQDQMLIEFDKTAKFSLYGKSLAATADSMLVAGASADALYAFCIRGFAEVGSGRSLEKGQLALWLPGGEPPEVYHVDVRRWMQSVNLEESSALQESLEALAQKQKRAIFWGLLRPTGLNAQASTIAEVENVRRRYLLNPEVFQLRFEHQEDEVAHAVVQRFVTALHEGNEETIAALLAPGLGDARASQDNGPEAAEGRRGISARRPLAAAMLSRDWTHLHFYEIKPLESARTWAIRTDDGEYRARLHKGDGLYFVESFQPEGE